MRVFIVRTCYFGYILYLYIYTYNYKLHYARYIDKTHLLK